MPPIKPIFLTEKKRDFDKLFGSVNFPHTGFLNPPLLSIWVHACISVPARILKSTQIDVFNAFPRIPSLIRRTFELNSKNCPFISLSFQPTTNFYHSRNVLVPLSSVCVCVTTMYISAFVIFVFIFEETHHCFFLLCCYLFIYVLKWHQNTLDCCYYWVFIALDLKISTGCSHQQSQKDMGC